MHKLLVPIETFSDLSLSATYFAIEFAKRNPAKIYFLIFSRVPGRTRAAGEGQDPTKIRRKQFEELVQRARLEKINLEIFYSNENFFEGTSQFFRDHGLTEIVIALPSERDPAYGRLLEQAGEFRAQLESQLIVVKPKEVDSMTPENLKTGGELPPALNSRPPAGKKGS